MELQRTTAGTLAPPRTSGTEGLWSVLGRLIFCVAVPLPIQSKNRIVTHRRKVSFIFHFCRSDASHVLASSSMHCDHPRKHFQRTLKPKEWLVIFCAPASVPPKQCSTAHLSLKKARKNTSPLSGKTPFFSHSAPRFPTVAAHRIAVNAHLACAHTHAPQSVFVFCLHPSRWGLSSLIARALGVKTPPIFRPSPPLPTCAARVKVEAQKPSPLTHWWSTR